MKLKKYVLVLFVMILVFGAVGVFMMPHFSSAEDLAPAKPNISANLEERGKQLRAAIDQTYKKMIDEHTIKSSANDISAAVIQYIPLGTSFDDAEKILRAAGFKIRSRPGADTPRVGAEGSAADVRRFDEVAAIDPYIPSEWFGPKTSIYVSLSPQPPQDYTKVLNIHAFISDTSL